MSVTSSRLRHQGLPGLQAQKCVSTVKTRASAIVTGTTWAIACPSIAMTSMGRFDIEASSGLQQRSVTPARLKSHEHRGRDLLARAYYTRGPGKFSFFI